MLDWEKTEGGVVTIHEVEGVEVVEYPEGWGRV